MSKRALRLLVVRCLFVGTCWAADGPFIGEWKLNASNRGDRAIS